MRQGTEVEVVAQAGPALRRAVGAGRQVGQRKWLFFSRPSGPSGRLGAEWAALLLQKVCIFRLSGSQHLGERQGVN